MPAINPTVPTQFRFTADDLAEIDRIRSHLGVRSRAEALRVAIRAYVQTLPEPRKKTRKNPD